MECLKLEIIICEKDDKMVKGSLWVDVVFLMGFYIINIFWCLILN